MVCELIERNIMKKLGKILFGVVLMFVAIVIVVQIFGVKYLKKTVDKFVLPKVEEIVGVDVAVEDLSFNLLNGNVNVDGVVLGNPEGYVGDLLTISEFRTDLKMLPLFKQEVYINELVLKDVHLSIISKGVKSLNVRDVMNHVAEATASTNLNTLAKADTVPSEVEKIQSSESAVVLSSKESTDFTLKDSAFNCLFSFVMLPGDYIKEEYHLDWNLILEAKDITNVGGVGNSAGSIKVKSGSARKDSEPQVDINGIIYPLTDMSKPSFAFTGSVLKFNMTEIEEWCEALGVGSSDLDLSMDIVCEKGIYTSSSNIEFKFNNPKLYGSLEKHVKDVKLPNKISVKVPVVGSWDDPKIDLKPALSKVVFEVTKSTVINKYVPKEYRGTAKEVGDSISKGLDGLFDGKKK
jgi:hypothetical protein